MRTPHERLQAFLYILTRDHLPTGVVDEIIQKYVAEEADHLNLDHCKPILKSVACDWADRLIGKEERESEYRFGVFGVEGNQIMTTPFRTAEGARAAASAGAHVRRGRIVERETAFRDKIEWEDGPI